MTKLEALTSIAQTYLRMEIGKREPTKQEVGAAVFKVAQSLIPADGFERADAYRELCRRMITAVAMRAIQDARHGTARDPIVEMTEAEAKARAKHDRGWRARCMRGRWVVWCDASDHVVEF